VDCAGRAEEVLEAASEKQLRLRQIVLTHGHMDHIESLSRLVQLTSATVAIHELDAPMLRDPELNGAALFGYPYQEVPPDRLLHEGDLISLPDTDIALTVLHTPGHTPGSICLQSDTVLFSGDTLFAGGIGRMDLPGGSERDMMQSLRRLIAFPGELTVYPGHGPATTIGEEREGNPWL
jgi:hydroxyacylglutathione hydrolase